MIRWVCMCWLALLGGLGCGSSDANDGASEPMLVTSESNVFWKTGRVELGVAGSAEVTVSETALQLWYGFGGTFNEAGWDALSVLSEDDRRRAIELLFDAVDGAKFESGRIPIGANDYALSRYSLAEAPGDYAMTNFSIARDRERLIPYIEAALAVNPDLYFWASPWTPPAWLKTNRSTDAAPGRTPPYAPEDGLIESDPASLTAYALYLTKFVQEYQKAGIDVRAVHPQNEPGYGSAYPSCYWPAELYIQFVRDFLGPKFAADLPDTELWVGTLSAPADGEMALSLAEDPEAMKFVSGFGVQWNTKKEVPALKATNLPIVQTEHKCGNYSFRTDYWDIERFDPEKPQNDFAYGVESWKLIRDWIRAGVNGYSAWNMVLDTLGANNHATMPWHQNALLVVDREASTLLKTPAYYVFRHVSQYVEPMAKVLATTGGDALAFENPDGSRVVILYNEGSAKPGMVVSIAGTNVRFDMPANGWATLRYAR